MRRQGGRGRCIEIIEMSADHTQLAPSTRLGPYEIVALIGAGGMGEVYRARDPRLRRELAIKVLPRRMAEDSERLRRFKQEALALAAGAFLLALAALPGLAVISRMSACPYNRAG